MGGNLITLYKVNRIRRRDRDSTPNTLQSVKNRTVAISRHCQRLGRDSIRPPSGRCRTVKLQPLSRPNVWRSSPRWPGYIPSPPEFATMRRPSPTSPRCRYFARHPRVFPGNGPRRAPFSGLGQLNGAYRRNPCARSPLTCRASSR